MKNFLFSICFVLFCNTVQGQCINGSCNVQSYGVQSYGVQSYGVQSYGVQSYGVQSYSVPSMIYTIRGITEQERFYVTVYAWERNYTVPVINGILPEMSLNGSYNNVILNYSSGIEYTKEKYGNMKVIYYLSNENLKVFNPNERPSAPKAPNGSKVKLNTTVPKRPSNDEIDNIFNSNAVNASEINLKKPSGTIKIQRTSDQFIDNLFNK